MKSQYYNIIKNTFVFVLCLNWWKIGRNKLIKIIKKLVRRKSERKKHVLFYFFLIFFPYNFHLNQSRENFQNYKNFLLLFSFHIFNHKVMVFYYKNSCLFYNEFRKRHIHNSFFFLFWKTHLVNWIFYLVIYFQILNQKN